jgi:UPF0176 protein
MALEHPYFVLAFYTFQTIENPKAELALQKDYLGKLDATCRIYISEEGINGQLSLARDHALLYIDWMHSRKEFKNLDFKVHEWHEQAFPRLTLKYRKHLVGRDQDVDLTKQGEHLPPKQWKEMLESEEDALLLDIRNSYEWELGRFVGATLPPCETFRDFEKYADDLKSSHNPKEKKVMMYCTGGIRCEVYSALLKNKGFEKVYQLQGGIIKYGLEQGNKHWNGKLFVFDDRLSVPISKEAAPVIGKCRSCSAPCESYYNCANIDCNTLFLCCKECIKASLGCCQATCMESPRIRPVNHQNPHKPFRRKHHYTVGR